MTVALLDRAGKIFEDARARNASPAESMADALSMLRRFGAYEPKKTFRALGVPPEIEAVIEAVAKHHGFTLADLRRYEKKRQKISTNCARARGEAAYVVRVLSQVSYPELGRYFGGRHHSTIMSAREEFAARLRVDEVLRRRIDRMLGQGREQGAPSGQAVAS